MSKQFGTAFVVQYTTHDISALLEMAERIVFVTTGHEKEEELQSAIHIIMQAFDPVMDVIVPVGNVMANLLVGVCLEKLNVDLGRCQVAVFQDKKYHVMEIRLDR